MFIRAFFRGEPFRNRSSRWRESSHAAPWRRRVASTAGPVPISTYAPRTISFVAHYRAVTSSRPRRVPWCPVAERHASSIRCRACWRQSRARSCWPARRTPRCDGTNLRSVALDPYPWPRRCRGGGRRCRLRFPHLRLWFTEPAHPRPDRASQMQGDSQRPVGRSNAGRGLTLKKISVAYRRPFWRRVRPNRGWHAVWVGVVEVIGKPREKDENCKLEQTSILNIRKLTMSA